MMTIITLPVISVGSKSKWNSKGKKENKKDEDIEQKNNKILIIAAVQRFKCFKYSLQNLNSIKCT